MECIRKIVVSGSPYERGRQQGGLLKPLIHENINNIIDSLSSSVLDIGRYREITVRNAEFLKNRCPEQWEEMERRRRFIRRYTDHKYSILFYEGYFRRGLQYAAGTFWFDSGWPYLSD